MSQYFSDTEAEFKSIIYFENELSGGQKVCERGLM